MSPGFTSNADMFEKLGSPGLTLGETTRLTAELERSEVGLRPVRIGVSGNVTLDILGTYLRREALLHGQIAQVDIGSLDDRIGNARRFADASVDAIVMLDLADAAVPALEARAQLLTDAEVTAIVERLGSELAVALEATRGVRRVFVARLFRISVAPSEGGPDRVEEVIGRLNDAVTSVADAFPNVHVLASDALAAGLGLQHAVDLRSYQRFVAPFGQAFLEQLAGQVYRLSRGFDSYFYKALVVDGDNTLWGGILGEDLETGIQLAPFGHPAATFWRVQHVLLGLQRRGVLLCLCTKNEPADVDLLLRNHPHMVLRADDFAALLVNWDPKPDNLRRLADDLGIGLDSMIFLDDSRFECEAVTTQLPMVRTFQVPSDLSRYTGVIAQIQDLFLVNTITKESVEKTAQYRRFKLATANRDRFDTEDEYLASLGLRVTIRVNQAHAADRIAELTQKANQFNLTTRRYTSSEITQRMTGGSADVYSIDVSDRFGDAGLTGVVIVDYVQGEAVVDTFLLSCRVLGRGVEYACWGIFAARATERGMTDLSARYLPTQKNAQVRDFWDRVGLELVEETNSNGKAYRVRLTEAHFPETAYIEVTSVV